MYNTKDHSKDFALYKFQFRTYETIKPHKVFFGETGLSPVRP